MLLAVGTALLLENLALVRVRREAARRAARGRRRAARSATPICRPIAAAGDGDCAAADRRPAPVRAVHQPGRAMRALAQDREVTPAAGRRTSTASRRSGFAHRRGAGRCCRRPAGHRVRVNAGIGTAISIKAFIMIMIGGAGVVAGAILGALALGFARRSARAVPRLGHLPLIFIGADRVPDRPARRGSWASPGAEPRTLPPIEAAMQRLPACDLGGDRVPSRLGWRAGAAGRCLATSCRPLCSRPALSAQRADQRLRC